MTAVVRPVGVDHADLGDGRVPMLCPEIVAAETEVVEVHREALFIEETLKLVV